MTNAVCKSYNESWLVFPNCRLKAVSRNITSFNLIANLLYPANEISVEGQIFQKANGYKPWLFKASIDICRFLKKPYNPFAIFIFKLFKDFSNINHTCPFTVSIKHLC